MNVYGERHYIYIIVFLSVVYIAFFFFKKMLEYDMCKCKFLSFEICGKYSIKKIPAYIMCKKCILLSMTFAIYRYVYQMNGIISKE